MHQNLDWRLPPGKLSVVITFCDWMDMMEVNEQKPTHEKSWMKYCQTSSLPFSLSISQCDFLVSSCNDFSSTKHLNRTENVRRANKKLSRDTIKSRNRLVGYRLSPRSFIDLSFCFFCIQLCFDFIIYLFVCQLRQIDFIQKLANSSITSMAPRNLRNGWQTVSLRFSHHLIMNILSEQVWPPLELPAFGKRPK